MHANLGKKLVVVALAGALISSTSSLAQSAFADSVIGTPMAANMVMPKAATAPKTATAPKFAAVAKKSVIKSIAKVSYSIPLGAGYANLRTTVAYNLKGGSKAPRKTIGTFVASKTGAIRFTYTGTISSTATVFITANGKSLRSFSAALLRLLTNPTQAQAFVEPTPQPTLIPVPVTPTAAPTVAPAPMPTQAPEPTPTPTPALKDPLVPTFGIPNPTSDGYTIQIANFDKSFTWTAKDAASGKVFVSSTGQVTVTSLTGGTQSTLTVRSTQDGYNIGQATSPVITVLAPPAPAPVMAVGGGGGGGTVVYVNIYAPAITLSTSTITVNQLDPIPTYSISNAGSSITGFTISPAAPAGTTFNAVTGILSGNPTSAQATTTYTITATNGSGASTAQFSLTVLQGVIQQLSLITPLPMRVGDPDQMLNGSSSSGLPITYSVKSLLGVCSLLTLSTGEVDVHADGVGTCIVDASQAGSATYIAQTVEVTFQIIAAAVSPTAGPFIVIIDPNGGTDATTQSSVATSQVVAAGTTITLPILTSPIFTTYTWAIGDISGTPVTGTTVTITSDLTLVAVWA